MRQRVGGISGWGRRAAAGVVVVLGLCVGVHAAEAGSGGAGGGGGPVEVTPETLEKIRAFVEEARKAWDVPGCAVCVVSGDKTVFAEGFGLRDVASGEPVTPETLFAIGSSTKAFTATGLAMLVDEGHVKWDDAVRTHLPTFKLSDEVVAARMQVIDLVTHRSGMPRHDLAWYGSPASRDELYGRLEYLPLTADLRELFQYNNLMYMTAGIVTQRVSGKTWEEFMRERILDPLGMRESNLSIKGLAASPNAAKAYIDTEGTVKETPYRDIDNIGPAGSINSNVVEMAAWVKLQLGHGEYDGKRLVSESQMGFLHTPQVALSQPLGRAARDEEGDERHSLYGGYAVGWMTEAYRGKRLIHHGGAIDGFVANVSFMPDEGLGVVVLTNLGGSGLASVTTYTIYDMLLGLDAVDWTGKGLKQREVIKGMAAQQEAGDESIRVSNTTPSHPIGDYAGSYWHPGYGELLVKPGKGEDAALSVAVNGVSGPLEHFHYDVFRVPSGLSKGVKLNFRTNDRGAVSEVTITLEPSSPAVVFKRRATGGALTPEAMAAYEGEYDLMGQIVKVEKLASGGLGVTVQGQPSLGLRPAGEHEFDIVMPNDLEGFALKFEMDSGRAIRATFMQPNGVFIATRKGYVDPNEPTTADPKLSEEAVLKRYVGAYDLSGSEVRVEYRPDGKLWVTVPGQPAYEMEPTGPGAFRLILPNAIKGFNMNFEEANGTVTTAVFVQPNGKFRAPRKP